MAATPLRWCPSCGGEYPAGVAACAVCRVALVAEQPAAVASTGGVRGDWVPVGTWPRLSAQILRARLETAGIDVLGAAEAADGLVTLAVPGDRAEFARAVVHEIEVDDEVPDTSPFAYVTRIEEHLAAVVELLDELRTRLDDLEADSGSGNASGRRRV